MHVFHLRSRGAPSELWNRVILNYHYLPCSQLFFYCKNSSNILPISCGGPPGVPKIPYHAFWCCEPFHLQLSLPLLLKFLVSCVKSDHLTLHSTLTITNELRHWILTAFRLALLYFKLGHSLRHPARRNKSFCHLRHTQVPVFNNSNTWKLTTPHCTLLILNQVHLQVPQAGTWAQSAKKSEWPQRWVYPIVGTKPETNLPGGF